MTRKLAITLAAAAASVALLVPSTGSAARPACVVVDAGPLHLQVGYAPNGPDDCRHLPR